MPIAQFLRVSKSFGTSRAVDAVSFDIEPGEFFSLLGPSGCGKTTTLRLFAGFEDPDADGGDIRIHGASALGKRPYERDLGMVFQSYALFPHRNVAGNVAFGLERRRVPEAERARRVARALETVRLDPDRFGPRRIAELSGGERQRVALARALVLEPPVLLLDEPLGAIDLKLRKTMQLELRQLHRALGVTFVYVTHDQDEALTMSDRIAVMEHGKIVQVGTPAEIYERPRTAFVAGFIGESNLLVEEGGTFALRPERLRLLPQDAAAAGLRTRDGTVLEVLYQGEMLRVLIALPGVGRWTVACPNDGSSVAGAQVAAGASVRVGWRPEDATPLEPA